MNLQQSLVRARNYYQKSAGRFVYRRTLMVRPHRPLISFSFDDFPRTALIAGGSILRHYDLSGTYYVSLGLLDMESPSGTICSLDDLRALVEQKHELGCHTYSHCHSWRTNPEAFEASIIKNRAELKKMFPDLEFRTFAYPLSVPHPRNKAKASRYFKGCRGGSQTLNVGRTDLNDLSATFIERTGGDMRVVRELIDRNRGESAWTIFATHDVSPHPSPYGCTPRFFEEIVEYALKSGALVLPVAQALNALTEESARSERPK